MITPAYEAFVNDTAMELFGLSKKEKDEKNKKEINNLSDKEIGKNSAINTCISYEDRNDQLLKKYGGADGILKELIKRTLIYVKDKSSIDIDDLGWKCLSIQPIFYSEIKESGNLKTKENVKTKESGFVDCSAKPVLYGIKLNTDELNRKYPNNGLPQIMVFEPWHEFALPIFDNNVGILCIYNKETGNITDFIMLNRDVVLKDAHSGHLKSHAEYFDYFEKKIK